MSPAKESNTSKTAHVMNLLSRNRGGASISAPTSGESPAPPQVSSTQMPVPTPPIIASMQSDLAVASKIKDALEASLMREEALEDRTELSASEPALTPCETSAEDATPRPSSAQKTAENTAEAVSSDPAHEALSVKPTPPDEMASSPVEVSGKEAPPDPVISEEKPLTGTVSDPDDAQSKAQESPSHTSAGPSESTDEKADTMKHPDPSNATVIANVMELLVEEMAEKYIVLFGLCPCEQCRKDVIALSLNHLPPKYVVMPQRIIRPRLAMYESRFSATITAQILYACKEVLENPRHDSDQ